MLDPAATLALAERVAEAARQLGVETALIDAAALAAHRYPRGTEDVELAIAVMSLPRSTLPGTSTALIDRAAQPRARRRWR